MKIRYYTRRRFLKALGAGMASLTVPSWVAGRQRTANKPNFIIIFADDQGYQDIGCFGSPSIRTPKNTRPRMAR